MAVETYKGFTQVGQLTDGEFSLDAMDYSARVGFTGAESHVHKETNTSFLISFYMESFKLDRLRILEDTPGKEFLIAMTSTSNRCDFVRSRKDIPLFMLCSQTEDGEIFYTVPGIVNEPLNTPNSKTNKLTYPINATLSYLGVAFLHYHSTGSLPLKSFNSEEDLEMMLRNLYLEVGH